MRSVEQRGRAAAIVSWGAFVVCLFAASYGQDKGHRRLSNTSRPSPHRPKPIIPIQELEKKAIMSALTLLGGDKILAAKKLGISKTTMYRKLKEFGIGEETKIRS